MRDIKRAEIRTYAWKCVDCNVPVVNRMECYACNRAFRRWWRKDQNGALCKVDLPLGVVYLVDERRE